ncbi:MAG TPA: ATP-binding protein, partial [Abditibacteriaceae bacterium]
RTFLEERTKTYKHSEQRARLTLIFGAAVVVLLTFGLFSGLARNTHRMVEANISLQSEMNERAHAQGASRESQRVLTTLLSNLPGMVYRCRNDADWTLEFLSEGSIALTGYHPDDFVFERKVTLDGITHPDDRELVLKKIQEAVDSQSAFRFTYRIITATGEEKWVWEQGRPVGFEDDGCETLEGFITDITERKQVELKLKNSQANLNALVENAADSIWSIDRQYCLLTFNQAFSEAVHEISGLRLYPGFCLAEILDDERFSQWKIRYDRALAGERFMAEDTIEQNGVAVDRELSISPIMSDGEVTGVTVFGRDITDRKRMDRMKTEFISTVSHELRTPLTSIRGSLGLLAGGVTGELPAAAKPLVEIAMNNSERLVRLINDILDIEKIESGGMDFHLQPDDLEALVVEALELNRAYGEAFDVRFELDNQLTRKAQVYVDHDRLEQVLANLLSNAAKFSPQGETVTVSLLQHGSLLRVAVRDKGEGIPTEFRKRIFQKFAQADSSDTRQKGGTGLGLSISKALIENMNGYIGFETGAGGTTFYFDLPEWVARETQAAVPVSSSRPRILICEDDEDIAHLLTMMMSQLGYESDVAGNATEARALLARNSYHAMTLDLILPDQDGISLIRYLRSQPKTRDLPIVVV